MNNAEACRVEALVEETPSESDLKISEDAKRMNEELKSLFGDWPLAGVETKSKVPEMPGIYLISLIIPCQRKTIDIFRSPLMLRTT